MRPLLDPSQIDPQALQSIERFHTETLRQVQEAISKEEWVIIGMAQNPVVKKARQFLDGQKIKYTYLEFGSYFSQWKIRLAIKLWSGWPTFPQVFHKGRLIGGFKELSKAKGNFV